MKKITRYLCISLFVLSTFPAQLMALPAFNSKAVETKHETDRSTFNKLYSRLESIRKMEISKMSSTEKKVLRTEVLSINEQIKKLDGGVYLSVGAIIIIVLLLILIF